MSADQSRRFRNSSVLGCMEKNMAARRANCNATFCCICNKRLSWPTIPLPLARCRLFENFPFDPAGVVFSVQRIARELGPLLPAIELIVHAVEGQRLDLRARGHMKIGIFVPAIGVKEKFADAPRWLRRQRTRRKFQAQFVPAIHQSESLIARGNQFGDVTIARTPPAWSNSPIGVDRKSTRLNSS